MDPRVTFHWLDITQTFPVDDARWLQCAHLVPPRGHDPARIVHAELQLALDRLQVYPTLPHAALAADLVSTCYSPLGVLYLCTINSALFCGGQDTLYSLYRKEPAHPFPCSDGPALIAQIVDNLLEYETTMERVSREAQAYEAAWDRARRTLEERGSALLDTLTARATQHVGAKKAQQRYVAMQRFLDMTETHASALTARTLAQLGTDCRQDLLVVLYGALLRHGPQDPNFHGTPLYVALAQVLTSFGLVTTPSVDTAARTIGQFLRRAGLVTPRRRPRSA